MKKSPTCTYLPIIIYKYYDGEVLPSLPAAKGANNITPLSLLGGRTYIFF